MVKAVYLFYVFDLYVYVYLFCMCAICSVCIAVNNFFFSVCLSVFGKIIVSWVSVKYTKQVK